MINKNPRSTKNIILRIITIRNALIGTNSYPVFRVLMSNNFYYPSTAGSYRSDVFIGSNIVVEFQDQNPDNELNIKVTGGIENTNFIIDFTTNNEQRYNTEVTITDK